MESSFISTLAGFAADLNVDQLPVEVVDRAKACIIDAIACAFSGYQTGISQQIGKALPLVDNGSQQASVWVKGGKTNYFHAAVHNCLLVHNMIHDDMNESCRGHIGNLVIPTVLALSEVHGLSGKDILAAVVAGYEVTGRIASPAVEYSVERGFRGTATYGPFGVAAAASRLLGHDGRTLAGAVSCAAGFSSGLLEPFDNGSAEWKLQNGMAIIGGIMAAKTAAAGFNSSMTAITGDNGFLKAFCGAGVAKKIRQAWSDNLSTLGRDFEISKTYFKPYATCGYNQISCDIVLKLVKQNQIRADQVEKIVVRVSPENKAYPGVAYKGPFDSLDDALLSKPFTIGAAVVFGDLQVTTYLEGIQNPDLLKIAGCVEMESVDSYSALETEIRIITRDGKTYKGDLAMADLKQFFPDKEMMGKKLDQMAGTFLSQERQTRILEEVADLEQKRDASALTGLLIGDT